MSLHCEYLPATAGAQQDIVLLHGWGTTREVWRPLLALLRPWANVMLFDIPGCAPGADIGTVSDLEQTLVAILDCSPARAVYLGWSLGGQLAVELAARHPDRVLAVATVATNPCFVAIPDWPGMRPTQFGEFRKGVEADASVALKRFAALQVMGSSQPRALRRQLQKLDNAAVSSSLLPGISWLQALDQRATVAALQAPQLHLLAAHDELVPAAVAPSLEVLLAGNSSAEVTTIPAVCHVVPLELPDAIAREVHGFLSNNILLNARQSVVTELDKSDVAASFSRAATLYDSVARLQRDVGEALLARLDGWQGEPATLLDLGCGTGHFYRQLQARYPAAQYIGLDLAQGMVEFARDHGDARCEWLVGDAEALPLASNSVDLIFSSLAVQWCYHPTHLFAELGRVLRPGGVCIFTSLGPQTLQELRASWASVDSNAHVNSFLSGAELLAASKTVPGITLALESRLFRMEYQRVRDLLTELKTLGAHNMNKNRSFGLTGRRALQGMLQAYESWRCDGLLPATYDVVFGRLEKL